MTLEGSHGGTGIFRNFLSYVQRQRWALFFYLSILMHLSLFTHLAIQGLKAQELEICNKPQIQLMAQMVPAPKAPGQPGEESKPSDGGGFEHGPMADSQGKGNGDFAEEFGIPGGKWKEQLDRTEEGEKLNENYGGKEEKSAINNAVPEEYRNRKRDYRNIIAKDIFPTLNNIDKPFREEIKEAPQELEKMHERNEVIENYRLWREGKAIPDKKRTKVIVKRTQEGAAGKLSFDEAARRKYFDETLSDPKEQQLDRFLQDYGKFDPNDGDLPRAIRDLYYENLQRVASTFNHSDPTYLAIDYYHEALNKEEFLRKALDVAAKKRGTKYATEILFAIENIYEIQGRALNMLFDMKKYIDSLPPKARENIRVQTLDKVAKRYLPLAEKKGIRNGPAALQHYYLKRTEILDYLTENTPGGYRIKDATFAKGRVFWESVEPGNPASWQNAKRAVDIWRGIENLNDTGDFLTQEIHTAMKESLGKFKTLNSLEGQRIAQALNQNNARLMQKKIERENRLLWSSKSAQAKGKK